MSCNAASGSHWFLYQDFRSNQEYLRSSYPYPSAIFRAQAAQRLLRRSASTAATGQAKIAVANAILICYILDDSRRGFL